MKNENDVAIIRVPAHLIPAGGKLVEAYETATEIIVCGEPPSVYPEGTPEDDWHNCDAMGCGTLSHVVYRFPKAGAISAPAPGVELLCLICAYLKPWGIFDSKTGAAVCVECRDKARSLLTV